MCIFYVTHQKPGNKTDSEELPSLWPTNVSTFNCTPLSCSDEEKLHSGQILGRRQHYLRLVGQLSTRITSYAPVDRKKSIFTHIYTLKEENTQNYQKIRSSALYINKHDKTRHNMTSLMLHDVIRFFLRILAAEIMVTFSYICKRGEMLAVLRTDRCLVKFEFCVFVGIIFFFKCSDYF